jgi:hypothetical protein
MNRNGGMKRNFSLQQFDKSSIEKIKIKSLAKENIQIKEKDMFILTRPKMITTASRFNNNNNKTSKFFKTKTNQLNNILITKKINNPNEYIDPILNKRNQATISYSENFSNYNNNNDDIKLAKSNKMFLTSMSISMTGNNTNIKSKNSFINTKKLNKFNILKNYQLGSLNVKNSKNNRNTFSNIKSFNSLQESYLNFNDKSKLTYNFNYKCNNKKNSNNSHSSRLHNSGSMSVNKTRLYSPLSKSQAVVVASAKEKKRSFILLSENYKKVKRYEKSNDKNKIKNDNFDIYTDNQKRNNSLYDIKKQNNNSNSNNKLYNINKIKNKKVIQSLKIKNTLNDNTDEFNPSKKFKYLKDEMNKSRKKIKTIISLLHQTQNQNDEYLKCFGIMNKLDQIKKNKNNKN